MCPSPSAHSDSSSGNGRLSSAGSDAGVGLLNNNNNNCSSKLSDILRGATGGNNGHLHQQYGVDDLHSANRMALMTAAGLGSPGVDTSAAGAVQAAVVNLANAMRQQQTINNGSTSGASGDGPSISPPLITNDQASAAAHAAMNAMRVSMADSMMRSSMAGGVDPMNLNQSHHHHHQNHQHQQHSPEAALRMHQAEAILRSQAEAALRLAVSQAAAVAASSSSVNNSLNSNNNISGSNGTDLNVNSLRHHNGSFSGSAGASGTSNTGNVNSQQNNQLSNQSQQSTSQNAQAQNQQLSSGGSHQLTQQVSPELSEALRFQEQRLEQALRLHGGDPRALGFALSNHQQNQQHQSHNH